MSLSAEARVRFSGLPAVEVEFSGVVPSFAVDFFDEAKMDPLGSVHVSPTKFGRGRSIRVEAEGSCANEAWELLRVAERVLVKGRPSSSPSSSVWHLLLSSFEFSFR